MYENSLLQDVENIKKEIADRDRCQLERSQWEESSAFWWIKTKSSSQKGKIGENIMSCTHRRLGRVVESRGDSQHDRLIDGAKYEAKLACLTWSGKIKWQHVRMHYNFDVLHLLAVFPEELRMYQLQKNDIQDFINKQIFKMYRVKKPGEQDLYSDLSGNDLLDKKGVGQLFEPFRLLTEFDSEWNDQLHSRSLMPAPVELESSLDTVESLF